MPAPVIIPDDYTYTLIPLLFSGLLNFYHGLLVGRHRKLAKVPYPNAYVPASEANADLAKYRFNCAQRAHANYIENWPQFASSLVVAGLWYPKAAAVAGGVWAVGRLVYARGYSGSAQIGDDGKGRIGLGMVYFLAQLSLWGMSGWGLWKAVSFGL
ncbi:membrane-associated proteins in eicosanoid and glutathione metabolism [Ascodesmis nigricans]|uniref:Membrane-associated proteins in eicosanoid and glutathione metabolism n=1 Tax=Ascodesmis nigricans TaxID=341454 RepID=A0A4S2MQJ4_9PEZI|nr:membrane-associated proteins in eicosanoid and glutathione metabolism [Ascodesmis nigricans]